jgi:hypothetical protein
MNDDLFSHPAEAERDTAAGDDAAEPVAMPVFSHRDQ